MKKRLLAIVVLAFLILVNASPAFAHGAGEHWQEMRLILFGDENYNAGKSQAIKDRINILQYASQVCIDQFGKDNCKASLIRLHELGVVRLPKTIDEITLYPLHNDHRGYSHLGWDFDYSEYDDERNPDWTKRVWPKRQEILLSAVEKVFNFNGLPDFTDRILGNYTDQGRAFTKLLYYIHLLGDHIEYTASSYEKGKDQVIPLAGTREDSLIGEVLEILPILFPEQNYSSLERELQDLNTQIVGLTNNPEQLKADFDPYHQKAIKVKETLSRYLPELLRNEKYFSNAFPT